VKHKVKKKSFKPGVREDAIGYGLPNNEEFLNYGVIIPHDTKNDSFRIPRHFYLNYLQHFGHADKVK
jgi:hypothetical protein